ncbi:MAG TPA: phage tail protein [Paludibacteraceae bacterium]|jgi:phage tail-like protein|nr:phage tail protein [Paludibacteraceae bacterium]HOU67063.1 phage tail protein [Paludibacteraceae bacterium]HPH62953.1 phage tail protein [Paludibacteraceae bacterium]HQF49235.1 phage tail protein [Paludibacteraceae bacterium]HQJ89958.1 phage tail protein [Paludibacteraceae bacterium]
MAEATNNYPLPVFHYSVKWSKNEKDLCFSEVTGLNVETQVIEYRDGYNPDFTTFKMPGIKKYSNITLKRGTTAADNGFFDWWNDAKWNTVERREITICLLNEKHEPVITWKVKNAFPTKVDFGQLKANGNEVLVESLELAHEGLTVERNSKE